MEEVFLRYLTVSLTCSAVLLPLLLLYHSIQRRVAGKSLYVLFLLLAVRLILPVQLRLPQGQVTVELPRYQVTQVVALAPEGGEERVAGPAPVIQAGQEAQARSETSAPPLTAAQVAALVWLAGCAVSLLVLLLPYGLLRRRLLRETAPAEGDTAALAAEIGAELGIRRLPALRQGGQAGPVMLGLVGPVIFLPAGETDREALELVLRHELTHLRRRDIAYKGVLTLACVLHWFNPLVWRMSRLAGENVELCCDDQVVAPMGPGGRGRYGAMLLRAAGGGRRMPLSTCFAAGKGQMRSRIANLFSKKKNCAPLVAGVTALALVAGSLVACSAKPLSAGTPAEALDALAGSVERTEEGFAFTVPQGYDGVSWNIHIAGRAEGPGGAMSVHYLEDAVWTPGENYLVICEEETLLSLDMDVTVTDSAGGEESRTISLVEEREGDGTALRETYRAFFAGAYPMADTCSVLLADLTDDGADELLVMQIMDTDGLPMDMRGNLDFAQFAWAQLTVYTGRESGVEPLWSGRIASAHAGWGSYYLYTDETGGEYLLWYSDYANQGIATPNYRLFTLNQEGEEQAAEFGTVTYLMKEEIPYGPEDLSSQEEIDAFEGRVAELTGSRSALLMGYEGNTLSYFDAPPEDIFAGVTGFTVKVAGYGADYFQELLAMPKYSVLLTHTYADPTGIDPNQALYNGSPWIQWSQADLTQAEKEALSARWPDMAFDVDLFKVTTAQADAFLSQMAGVTLADLSTPFDWTYLPSTDSYYHAHGDTNMVTPQVEAVELGEREALVSYSIEGLGEFVLTLRAQDGRWVVYANQPA